MAASTNTTAPTEDDALGKAYDARLVRRLLAYVRPYRPLVVAALACIIVQSGMQLVGPLLTRWVIDRALPARDVGLVVQVAFMYAALLVAQFGAAFGETMFTSLLGQRVMRDLRRELFERLQRLPVSYFDRNPVGRLVTRVTSDVEALNELFTSGVVAGVGDLFTLLAIGVVMLYVDWQLAMAAFVVIPLVLIASRVFQNSVRTAYRDIRTRLARLNAFIGERIGGMRIVQLFGREAHEVRRFDALNQSHLDAHLKSITVYALYFPVIEFLTTFALASLLVTAGFRVGSSAITVGTVAAFLQLVRRFFQPLQDLSEKYNILQAAMAASERIFGLLDTPVAAGVAATPDRDARVGALRSAGVTVVFEDVWFAYDREQGVSDDHSPTSQRAADALRPADADLPGGRWVLKGVSFRVAPGQEIALVGHTGAGKTTIVNLLLRFYEPQRGRILVNGVDIRELPVDVLRSVIGYVQQDIFLFAGDVAGNLRLDADIDDEALAASAAQVGADRVIARLPGGWHHELAERGGGVSVGERQLLAFARAVAADPALLILDEATSAVDSQIEAEIQRAVSELMRGRTTIAIAHRLSTIVEADEILVLHHGEVVERGTHRELMTRQGLYDRLFRLQVGEPDVHESGDLPALPAEELPPVGPTDLSASSATRLPTDATLG
ncbi:ABC transporter ATP-binding protein [Gemmatimonas groenlandica]|uniref:ABC transporter ATP-binding protein n=1 Tax=Gemmatimonas groenlandica TaxID=2732249 RepID=A0A6M4IMF0_9BACT|nr:ABC transporter ATP-binding protein [Gemmatimonas groenlandica]QJR34596.1 ABC transporter ATP-binding protein [Gemmatimonas groenlandica]